MRELGKLVWTAGINAEIADSTEFAKFVSKSLKRYQSGDWGEMSDEDKKANDAAVRTGEDRIFASYKMSEDVKIWIITEWDRSYTTILFPSEY